MIPEKKLGLRRLSGKLEWWLGMKLESHLSNGRWAYFPTRSLNARSEDVNFGGIVFSWYHLTGFVSCSVVHLT